MTVEIKQLIVRAVVETPRAREIPAAPPRVEAAPVDRADIVATCVREVLRELERARER